MQAFFHLKRELNNRLDYSRVKSPSFNVHFHSNIELYCIRSGAVEVLINDQKRVLREGEFCISFSYDTHGYRSIGASEVEFLSIPTTYCEDILPLFDKKHVDSHFIDDPKTCQIVFDAMTELLKQPNELMQKGCVYLILGAVLDKTSSLPSEEKQGEHFSAEILIYISNHFREELTLSMLAKKFGYNPSYLSRSFRQRFGISFGKYLKMLRLREAVLLLRDGNASVTKSVIESGFGSMRSFYRAFQEEFGCTPKEYFSNKTPSIR